MAESGTRIPNDAGLQNTIPSVPRPDQKQRQQKGRGETEEHLFEERDFPLTAQADNPQDMPRSARDTGLPSGEVVSGTGDTMPDEIESKRLHFGTGDPGAKGSLRTYKHEVHRQTRFNKGAAEDPEGQRAADRQHEFRNPQSGG
jgi:hypothetical protein